MSEKREKAAAKWKAEEEERDRQREESEVASANGNSAADTPPKEPSKEPLKEETPVRKAEPPKVIAPWASGRTTPAFGGGISRTPTADREREQSDTLSEFEKVRGSPFYSSEQCARSEMFFSLFNCRTGERASQLQASSASCGRRWVWASVSLEMPFG
jgi:hypothetical protein